MRWSWLLVGLLALPVAGGCASSNSVPYDDTSAGGNAGSQGDAGSDSEGGKGGKGGKGGSGTSGQAGDGSGEGGRAGEPGEGGAAGDTSAEGGAAGSENAGGATAGSTAAGAGGEPFGGGGAGASAGTSAQGGAGTTSGSSGAGGAVGSSCAAAVTASVAPLQPLTISDDTNLSKNVFGAYCDPAGASGKDYVYKIVPSADGKIDLTLKPTTDAYDPVLSVTESECTVFVTSKDGGCTNFGGTGSGEARTVTAKAGQPFWVYVDGVKGHDGPFTLTAVYQGSGGAGGSGGSSGSSGQSGSSGVSGSSGAGGASGGSGQGGAGQAGTSATGGASGAAGSGQTDPDLGATCATPITVTATTGVTEVNGSTEGTGLKTGKFLGSCNATYDGPDRVIEVTAQAAGQLTIKAEPLASDYDIAVYALKDTCTTFVSLSSTSNGKGDCKQVLGPGVAETLNPLAVTAGQKVYVVVDTGTKNSTKGGPFRVTLTLQ